MRANNIVKYLCGTWWGSSPEILIVLYKSCVRSIIDYAGFIYLPSQKYNILKLEKAQYAAIRSALGYRKSTPTNIMLAEAKLLSLEQRTKLMCKCFIRKALSDNKSMTKETIEKYYTKLSKDKKRKGKINILNQCIEEIFENTNISNCAYNIYNHKYKTIATSIPIETNLGKTLQNAKDPNKKFQDFINEQNACAIYTDGSKSQISNFTGVACECPELQISIQKTIEKNASVYTAECYALSIALDIVIQNAGKNFLIFSDSLSALLNLNSTNFKSNINPHILNIKDKFVQYLNSNPNYFIKFYWIPSHIGIEGNEAVDNQAKIASKNNKSEPTLLPYTDYYENYKKDAKAQTITYLKDQGLDKGKNYFQFFYKDNNKPWYAQKN